MKWLLIVGVMALTMGTAKAQQVIYDENAEVRNTGSFSSIELSGTVFLYLIQAKETAVAVSAGDEKYNSKIITEVNNGVLKIAVDGGVWNGFSWTNRKLKAYVSVPDLNRLKVSGASYVHIMETLSITSLNVELSGASEIKGNIQVKNLNTGISGASVLRLTGTAENAAIDASGACKFYGSDLKIDNAKIDASGASVVTITVNTSLSANASGGSSIQYSGAAVPGTINTSGGASIKKRAEKD